MKFRRDGSLIESNSVYTLSGVLSPCPFPFPTRCYVVAFFCIRKNDHDEPPWVRKPRHRFSRETRGGPRRCREGPAFVSRAKGYVGNAGDSLSDIRYSHPRPSSLPRAFSALLPPPSRRASRRAPLMPPHDSRMCFVCITACSNVWALRYLSYGRAAADGSRTGCMYRYICCIRNRVPLLAARIV